MIQSDVIEYELKKIIIQRSYKAPYGEIYRLIGDKPFILAGGALCGDKVNDFDIYPVSGNEFKNEEIINTVGGGSDHTVLSITKNAITIKLVTGEVVQFCSYLKPTLKDLVESFDFSHIQVGVTFIGNDEPAHTSEVFFTDKFVLAQLSNKTEYVGSEYPLSSIIRVGKYYARGRLTRYGAGMSVIKALTDILRRGFKDYDDFKDQMDAVDLGYLEMRDARDLYTAASDVGLVKG